MGDFVELINKIERNPVNGWMNDSQKEVSENSVMIFRKC